jgi:hypothetical protein
LIQPIRFRQLPAVFLRSRGSRLERCVMKSKCFFALTALFVSGCAQVTGQLYSKNNFDSKSFATDMSECKRQNPSFAAIRSYAA